MILQNLDIRNEIYTRITELQDNYDVSNYRCEKLKIMKYTIGLPNYRILRN